MKQKLLFTALFFGAATTWGQQSLKGQLAPGSSGKIKARSSVSSTEKALLCVDTLRYPQAKEQILGTGNFYSGFGVWQADNESVSQAFVNSGPLTITGIEFFGARNTSGAASVTVSAAIYNVDAANVPTTIVGSANVTITATAYGYRFATFSTPVTVNGNYAVVLKPTNANGILNLYVNDVAIGQSYDELLTRFYSGYASYPNPNVWNTIPTFEGNAANYEPLVAPIVNYSINAAYTTSPSNATVCQGTPVTYTNTTTPAAHLSNRFTNYQVFKTFFGLATSDSTYVYDMDNSSAFIWTGNTTYTHPAAGSYDVMLGVNGGFWSSCFDFVTHPVTVNALPAAPTATAGGPVTFCSGGNVVLTSSAASGNTWSNGQTTQSITVNTAGNYTVTTTASGCTSPASAAVPVTVNPAEDASFTYPSYTLCTGSASVSPSAATAGGTYSAGTGLAINASTGEIDVAGSVAGTFTVTHTTGGSCPGTATQTVTITEAPDASFDYASAGYCITGSDPAPFFETGASAGTFSSSAGLSINSSTGVIDLSASTPGVYTVTNSIAASGSCAAASSTASITVNGTVTPSFEAADSYCEGSSIPALPSTSLNGVEGSWSPAINNMATTTYTFTPAAGECATTASTVIVIDEMTQPSFTAIENLCTDAIAPALPATSNNGVSGTWSPAVITTAVAGTSTYTFTPGSGSCAETATLSVTVEECLSLDENLFGNLSVFPNPVSGEVTISFDNAMLSDVELSLLTNEGKVVSSRTVQPNGTFSEKIDLRNIAAGAYFVRISTEAGSVTRKVVKQ